MSNGTDKSDPKTPEASSEDFQYVLKALLTAYRPVLEREVKRSESAQKLDEEASKNPPSCEDEIALARELFEKFFTPEVATRLIPAEHRGTFGERERWIWCYRHILCCIIFGWLVCRGPRTFRGAAYYLRRYWLCVREALGNPVSKPPTAEERRDFEVLFRELASAYSPYLQRQLRDLEYPFEISADVLEDKIDCHEGEAHAGAIFERLLTVEASSALFGSKEFTAHARDPIFRLCRCYCICAMQFGCCLARVRHVVDVHRCLKLFFACLHRCFRPLTGEIDTPVENACVSPVFVAHCDNLVGIEIDGTASGASFTHYSLGYSYGGPVLNDAVVYPDCSRPPAHTSSSTAVVSGLLGYLDRNLLPPGIDQFTVHLDVFGSGGLHIHVAHTFQLQTSAIEITAAATKPAVVGEDPFHLGTFRKLLKATNDSSVATPELSLGGSFSVTGSAYTIGCNRQMTQYVLAQFPAPPTSPIPTPPNATGGAPIKSPVIYADTPNHPWLSGCFLSSTPNTILNGDLVAEWSTEHCVFPGPPYDVPKISVDEKWSSNPTGRFVVLLEVRDRLLPAGVYPGDVAGVDQVAIWIDNQIPVAVISSIGGVSGCGDLHLKNYVGTTAPVIGIAWDYPIDFSAPQQAPNDNFGSYSMTFQKNGGGGGAIPALTPNLRVPNVWSAAPPPLPGGTLANWDIVAALDGGPGPGPAAPGKILRGERCAYVFTLSVSDTTWVGDGGNHNAWGPVLYAMNVINDIP
jgi:hypothetical protein